MDDIDKCFGFFCLSLPILYLIWKYFQGGQFQKYFPADGKIVIITGANTGIGKETALELARRGAKVYLACRDYNRGEQARQDIIAKSGNTMIFNCKLDLASLKSVREFVNEFLKQEKRLDILINNAGLVCENRTLTVDGFETTIGVNYFGHFLLTKLLLNTLKVSVPSRIVNVSSLVHTLGKINRNDLHGEHGYSRTTAYAQSKLANILFTRSLAKRLKNTRVMVNSLHPGWIRTEFDRNLPFHIKIFSYLCYFFMKTTKSGAQTTIALAVDPEYSDVTGKYFSDCKISKESKAAKDDETAEWLWNISEECTKLKTM